jgi:hypothetical protein
VDSVIALADAGQKLLGPFALLLSAWLGWLVYRATTDAPINAARLAALLAEEQSKKAEQERRRMYIFAVLMGARRAVYTPEVVTAFNLIDVIFHDCREVREAWAELYAAYADSRHNSEQGTALRDEKLKALLLRMAHALSIEAELRFEDISRVYVPESLSQQAIIDSLQRERRFRELTTPDQANAAAPPPAPPPARNDAFKTAPR